MEKVVLHSEDELPSVLEAVTGIWFVTNSVSHSVRCSCDLLVVISI